MIRRIEKLRPFVLSSHTSSEETHSHFRIYSLVARTEPFTKESIVLNIGKSESNTTHSTFVRAYNHANPKKKKKKDETRRKCENSVSIYLAVSVLIDAYLFGLGSKKHKWSE